MGSVARYGHGTGRQQAGAVAVWLPGPLHEGLAGGTGADGGGSGGSMSSHRAMHSLLAACSQELFGMDTDGHQFFFYKSRQNILRNCLFSML